MDRRVNPDVYLKMDLGSTFILRNPGNFVPHAADVPTSQSSSELAALEMTVNMLNLKNIIVCGHSDCKVNISDFLLLHLGQWSSREDLRAKSVSEY